MKEFRLIRWFKQLLGVSASKHDAAAVAPVPATAPAQPPLSESLAELNAAMRTLDGEMLRLAQAWQALGASLESMKQQRAQDEVNPSAFGRIDTNRLN